MERRVTFQPWSSCIHIILLFPLASTITAARFVVCFVVISVSLFPTVTSLSELRPAPLTLPMSLQDTERIAKALPKAELHLHLDGSLSEDFMFARAEKRGISMPGGRGELWSILRAGGAPGAAPEARAKVLSAMPRANPEANNWLHFDFCNQFLQTADELEEATKTLVVSLYNDGVRVIEIRFCPTLHVLEGLSAEDVVRHVVRGFDQGAQQCGGIGKTIIGGIIICALRTNPAEHGVEMAELAARWLGKGVVGWDLAADEGAHPLDKHISGLRRAKELGVPCTVHAGEWGSGPKSESNPNFFVQPGHFDTLPNLRLAVRENVQRIGHALTLYQDPELLQEVATRGIVVECCLTSNRKRMAKWSDHPITSMRAGGCSVTLNSDNQFLSNTSSTQEVVRYMEEVGGSWESVREALLTAAGASFYWAARSEDAEHEDRLSKSAFLARMEGEIDAVLKGDEGVRGQRGREEGGAGHQGQKTCERGGE